LSLRTTTTRSIEIIEASQSLPNTFASRQEIHTLVNDTERWNQFVDAAHAIKANGIYDHLVAVHQAAANTDRMAGYTNAAHFGPSFLPWHRVFLNMYERALQIAANDTTLAIPYWDWTIDHKGGAATLSTIFNSQFLGSPVDGAVKDGAFCTIDNNGSALCPESGRSWPVRLDGPNLNRTIIFENYAELPSDENMMDLLRMRTYDVAPYHPFNRNGDIVMNTRSFRVALEGWSRPANWTGSDSRLHNGVHVWMGGSMLPMTSPNDPVFYMHHANVDRLWSLWEASTCRSINPSEAVAGGAWCYRPRNGADVTRQVPGATCTRNSCSNLEGQMLTSAMFPTRVTPAKVAGPSDVFAYARSTGFN
jgi:tyrosinase